MNARPLRVAFVAPSLGESEGQGRVNLECLRRLAASGMHIDLFTSRIPDAGIPGVRAHVMRRRSGIQLLNQIRFGLWASRKVRRGTYDVVHADGASLLRRADVVAAHMLHSVWRRAGGSRDRGPRRLYHRFSTALNTRLERRAYHRARLIVANSARTADDLVRVIGVERAKIRILPLGVDAQRFHVPTAAERAKARADIGALPGQFVAVLVGATDARKGVPQAIEAFRDLEDARLIVVGDTRGSGIARSAPHVTFAEWPADPLPYYWAADAVLHPALYEPFGLSVLEGMACGLPIAVTESSGVAEVCNGSAITVSADPDSIRDAVGRLRTDAEVRAQMARRARAIAQARTWDDTANALHATYREVSR